MTGARFEPDAAGDAAIEKPGLSPEGSQDESQAESPLGTVAATVAAVGVVGVAAVVFEAALIPGIVLGAAAALAPSYLPRLGTAFGPLLRSSVRGAYKIGHKTHEMMAEAREHLHDIAAEVQAEQGGSGGSQVG